MPRSTLQQEMEMKKAAARAKAEASEKEARARLRTSAAVCIQAASRRMQARRTVYELRRPRTSQEILAERKLIFLEHRRAARSAGYGVQMLPQKAVEAYVQRIKEAREQFAAKAPDRELSAEALVTVFAERDQVANRLRALSKRQRAVTMRQRATARARNSHANDCKADEVAPAAEDSTPSIGVSVNNGRQRRVSKELMAIARRAARKSHDAIKSLSA